MAMQKKIRIITDLTLLCRKSAQTHETAPKFLYKHVILATHSCRTVVKRIATVTTLWLSPKNLSRWSQKTTQKLKQKLSQVQA